MDKKHQEDKNKKAEEKNLKNTNIKEDTKKETANKENKKSELEFLKEEHEKLEKELKLEKEKNIKLNLEIVKLESQIQKINKEYIDKVSEKAKEAQELVNKKHLELEEKAKTEINRQVDRLIESKFDSLLTAIEQLTKIVETPSSSPEVNNYTLGFKMILGIIQNALNELGISQIIIEVGQEFDENLMQAFEMVDDKKVKAHHVAHVFSNAYKYKDSIIKHAVVKVQK